MSEHLENCRQSIIDGDAEKSAELAQATLDQGMNVLEVIDKGFVSGIREVGRLWEEGELFLPELVIGADAMKKAMDILQPALEAGDGQDTLGHVVIGTIEGDIHDIGKTLVATMLAANGFEVTDLGADVPVAKFVETAEEKKADWIAISALLTTTMPGQKKVIEMLSEKSISGVKVMVGGAPCNEEWASEIGADGYAGDAVAAVALAKGS